MSVRVEVPRILVPEPKEIKLSAPVESRPKRSLNAEGPSFPFWY